MIIKILETYPNTDHVKRVSNANGRDKAKPFIQWVGGKRELIPLYEEFLPKKFNVYFEPFLGGGAMFFYLQPEKSIISDNNPELIKTYEGVRDNPEEIIELLKELRKKHSKELYMAIRNIDREIDILTELTASEIAARFIYLNQTCFNGIYRVNKKGQFNVPIGSSLNRLICDEETLKNASKVLKTAEISCSDFGNLLKKAAEGDFVYLDPPYFPISKYSDFTRYTKEKFYKDDQIRLKENIDYLTKKGVKIMLSNSNSEFIKDIYSNYKIISVQSSRSLNSDKNKRGKVSELLIINY